MSKFPHTSLKLATASLLAIAVLSACNKPADNRHRGPGRHHGYPRHDNASSQRRMA